MAARAGLAGVSVTWTHPGPDGGRECIFYGATELEETPGSLGGGIRHESYTLEVWAYVHQEGDTPQAAEERCWAIVAEIEGSLRSPSGASDLGLGPPDVHTLTAQFAGAAEHNFAEDEGYTAQVLCSIAVEARI